MILPVLLAVLSSTPAHFAAAAAPAPAPVKLEQPSIEPKSEIGCGVMIGAGAKKPPIYKAQAGFKVLGTTGALALPKVDGAVEAVRCTRDTIIPGAGDGRVLWELRKPLLLTDGLRTGVLQMKKPEKGQAPQYQFGMVKGTLTAEEKTAVLDRLRILDVNLIAVIREIQAQRAKAKTDDAPIPAKQ